MKNIILTLLILCSLAIVLPLQAQVTLNGRLNGLKADSISFSYQINDSLYQDRVAVKSGTFTWKAKINNPVMVNLKVPFQSAYFDYPFFAERGEMKVQGNIETIDSILKIKISGSPTQSLYHYYIEQRLKLFDESSRLEGLLAKSKPDSAKLLNKEMEVLMEKVRSGLAISIIKANPKNFASLYLVELLISNRIDYKTANHLFLQLDPSLKSSASALATKKNLAVLQLSAAGKALKPFSIPDQQGKTVALEDYKGKILLVDFWAGWCGPCRAENPNLLKNYQQHQAKGFDIVGISCDTDSTKWKKAVKEDQLPWKQVRDWEILKYYGITAIPANFLVDGNGKILGSNLIGESLTKKLTELFSSK